MDCYFRNLQSMLDQAGETWEATIAVLEAKPSLATPENASKQVKYAMGGYRPKNHKSYICLVDRVFLSS